MNKKIKQPCQKVDVRDICNKKFEPCWFFTNEKIGNFLSKVPDQGEINKIFSVGAGDFAFNCLTNLDNVTEINTCDIRPIANITVDLKIGLIKSLSFYQFLNLFQDFESDNKSMIYGNARSHISPFSKKALDFIVNESKQQNFMSCVRESGHWYGYSCWNIEGKRDYVPYLTQDNHNLLQKNVDKINIYHGDFNDNLMTFEDAFYDLVYASNIFDSKKYCTEAESYLHNIRAKTRKDGFLLIASMTRSKKTIRLVEKNGFKLYEKELHKFNTIAQLFFGRGEFCWNFLLFKRVA